MCVSIIFYIFIVLEAYGYSDYLHMLWKHIISSIYSASDILHICRDIAKQRCRIVEISGAKARYQLIRKMNFHKQSHSTLFPTLYFVEFNCSKVKKEAWTILSPGNITNFIFNSTSFIVPRMLIAICGSLLVLYMLHCWGLNGFNEVLQFIFQKVK